MTEQTISEIPQAKNPTMMEYAELGVDLLKPSPQNARTHPPAQIEKIKKSIVKFGFKIPILISADRTVIAGHGRLEAAKALGMNTVPTLLADHMDDEHRRAYMLADNRIAEDGGYNDEILISELRALQDADFDLSETGFDDGELLRLLAEPIDGDEEATPALPRIVRSRTGDTWLLGKHRVRCGDATNADDVAALLQATIPNVMVTDPPYGVEYDASWRGEAKSSDGKRTSLGVHATGKVLNDDRADWREAWELFPGNVAYVWHAGNHAHTVAQSLIASGFELRAQIIWNKNNFAIGRGDYHWKHEPCWYAVRNGNGSDWQGSRKESTVWDIDKPQKSETGHSTQKPVDCMRMPIVNNTGFGELVYDPFCRSGTTIIAAEAEKRICYGMELNPAYVDVIVSRWQKFTGQEAIREADGVTFNTLLQGDA